jgi:hypothetical protein
MKQGREKLSESFRKTFTAAVSLLETSNGRRSSTSVKELVFEQRLWCYRPQRYLKKTLSFCSRQQFAFCTLLTRLSSRFSMALVEF